MKHYALVWMLAAAVAAQGQGTPDPKVELAKVIAVEEQERDLAKAETMYRELLADTKLSEAGRMMANARLGQMLQKLGRAEEAKPFLVAGKEKLGGFDEFGAAPTPQDVAREKALREKARELVQRILEQQGAAWAAPLHGIGDQTLAEQLVWIGEAAVPEVIAVLQAEVRPAGAGGVERGWTTTRLNAVKGLAGFLWRTGGTLSAAYLASCAKLEDRDLRAAIVATAFQAEHPTMLAEAVRFLNDPDPDDKVVESLLNTSGQGGAPLNRRFEPAQIVDAALRGPLRGKIRVLGWARSMSQFDAATLTKLHGLAREGLQSTEPELGGAANQFLLSTASQASLDGLLLLLQELPRAKGAPNGMPQPSPEMLRHGGGRSRFSAEEAAKLLPAVDACARTLGDGNQEASSKRNWLQLLMVEVGIVGDAKVVPTVLAWMDLGFNVWYALDGKITAANSKDVFARFDRLGDHDQTQLVILLAQIDLPTDLFPLLRDKADAVRDRPRNHDPLGAFLAAMAKTGNPDAADWILAAKKKVQHPDRLAGPLLDLARRARSDTVRAALRSAVETDGMSLDQRGQLLLALLAMHDEPALDLVVKLAPYPVQTLQPLAQKEEAFRGHPLNYLLYENPDPPHGFTDDQVIGVLRKIAANQIPGNWEPRFFTTGAIRDRLLGEIALLTAGVQPRTSDAGYAAQQWVRLTIDREQGGDAALAGWTERALHHETPLVRQTVASAMNDDHVRRYRASLEALVDDADAGVRDAALAKLLPRGVLFDAKWLARLLAHADPNVHNWAIGYIAAKLGEPAAAAVVPFLKSPEIRVRVSAAEFLGSIVHKDAVPDLIALLRDTDERVRKAAADALTRIRFYHEQQAHWDRVLKGLDASPASAAEKLLIQAKPTAPKDQRLLAITSLGTLGVAEALPFLIEWTTDTDTEIAAAAKAAISQIHLNPRR